MANLTRLFIGGPDFQRSMQLFEGVFGVKLFFFCVKLNLKLTYMVVVLSSCVCVY